MQRIAMTYLIDGSRKTFGVDNDEGGVTSLLDVSLTFEHRFQTKHNQKLTVLLLVAEDRAMGRI